MNKHEYSQNKRQREQNKARKKREKAARREQQREQGPDKVEIVMAEDIVGRLPSSTEAMLVLEERAKAPRKAASVPCQLFIGGLSWDTTENMLREIFAEIGSVSEVVIPVDSNTRKSRGFGFVTFKNRKDGAQAIERFDGYELDGRNIIVKIATKR